MSPPRYQQAAALVRDQITGGALTPGTPAPSGAALAGMTGYSVRTCRRALRTLVTDGTLAAGASSNARPRVPAPGDQALADAKRALSTALAGYRRAAGLTQRQFAAHIGVPLTNIGHAETGRLWQSRPFWELADEALRADGELLRLHDAFRAAEAAPPEPGPAEPPAVVTVNVPGPVAAITITWASGAVTTVRPPATNQARENHEQ